MTHLDQVTDHAVRVWERKWTPVKDIIQPGAILGNQERADLVREMVGGLLENYTLVRKDGGDTLGGAVRAARELKGMTQLQLGNAVGRSKFTVSQWESNRHRPQGADLQNLWEVLGQSVYTASLRHKAP